MSEGDRPPGPPELPADVRALASVSLERLWDDLARSDLPADVSPAAREELKATWFCGALTAIRVAQLCARLAPAFRDEQLQRLAVECWSFARTRAGSGGLN
jgi:hypothetical protein